MGEYNTMKALTAARGWRAPGKNWMIPDNQAVSLTISFEFPVFSWVDNVKWPSLREEELDTFTTQWCEA